MPDGILLVTGPTGSGKTTTLYSCLNFINRPDRKIITVEDPVEYMLAGINQVQVNETVGLDVSRRRCAPCCARRRTSIMLGEIRDLETATIAINASLTGHLVFSTLHTNDAPERGDPFDGHRRQAVSGRLLHALPDGAAAGAQNLQEMRARRISRPRRELRALEHRRRTSCRAPRFMKGKGCNDCNKTGYRGRFGIFEIFVIDDEARKLIYDRVPSSVLRARAREMGMRTLREDGVRKVLAGADHAGGSHPRHRGRC